MRVGRKELIRQAEQLERDARDSLFAWSLLGQFDKYGEMMAQARNLRRAAAEPKISLRREMPS